MAPPRDVFPVIMAGGSGTRFWPLSRARRPKQFLALTSARPLLVETHARLKGVGPPGQVSVVCGAAHAAQVRRLLKELPRANVLVEPQARNTGPAIAFACAWVTRQDPRGVLVVVPSDQHVQDVKGFQRAVAEAVRVARAGRIVTLGIEPTRPETGYGYIRLGAPLDGVAHEVKAFVEKPDASTAGAYVRSGEYLWNAGLYVFRADVMLEALARHHPELHQGALALLRTRGELRRALPKAYAAMPQVSIDYAVAEKARNIAVVPGRFGWSDVGSFPALAEVREADAQGNVLLGTGALALDCQDCVVVSQERPLAVVGLKGMVVVDSGDAVLVLPKAQSQDVRKVVEALRAGKQRRYL